MPTYKLNDNKIIEVILFLCNKNKGQVTIYQIMKAIYNAEIYHLNMYFRPVLGDLIKAFDCGPVPYRTYNMANGNIQVENKPFYRKENAIIPNREPNLDKISKSDIKALDYGWELVKDVPFDVTKDVTHDEIYFKALEENEGDYEYFYLLYPSNKDKAQEIFEFSEYLVL